MPLDGATVARIADLARLRVPEAELGPLAKELSNIIGWIEQLGEVDVEGVEPMTSVAPMRPKQREDVVTDGGNAEAVIANAPESKDGYFLVPKVIE